ncbi:MAG TPA: cyclic nucleotide-binding domain-containing protein, partial [Ilumatobacteraceae bacterium]
MSTADDLRGAFLTSDLTDEQLEQLCAAGREVAFRADDELFHEGVPAHHLWILLEGEVELSRQIGNQKIVMTTMTTPGQWAGGLT